MISFLSDFGFNYYHIVSETKFSTLQELVVDHIHIQTEVTKNCSHFSNELFVWIALVQRRNECSSHEVLFMYSTKTAYNFG